MIQKEANKIMEGVEFDPALTYATSIKIYLQCLFFLPIIPITAFFAVVALILFYWVKKFIILRRAARPTQIDYQILFAPLHLIKGSPIFLGVGLSRIF